MRLLFWEYTFVNDLRKNIRDLRQIHDLRKSTILENAQSEKIHNLRKISDLRKIADLRKSTISENSWAQGTVFFIMV